MRLGFMHACRSACQGMHTPAKEEQPVLRNGDDVGYHGHPGRSSDGQSLDRLSQKQHCNATGDHIKKQSFWDPAPPQPGSAHRSCDPELGRVAAGPFPRGHCQQNAHCSGQQSTLDTAAQCTLELANLVCKRSAMDDERRQAAQGVQIGHTGHAEVTIAQAAHADAGM